MARNLDPRTSAQSAFALELLRHRKRAGLSQAAVARQLNCDQSLVSHFERGERVPQRDHAVVLDRLFGVAAQKVLVGLHDGIVRESRSPR